MARTAINRNQVNLSTDQILLGRFTAGEGLAEEIAVGSGLSLVAGVLSSSATGITWINITVDLGLIPRKSGNFIITSTGLTTGRQVIIQQATGGANNDDLEMDNISANGIVVNPTTIKVFWNSASVVVNSKNFNYLQV